MLFFRNFFLTFWKVDWNILLLLFVCSEQLPVCFVQHHFSKSWKPFFCVASCSCVTWASWICDTSRSSTTRRWWKWWGNVATSALSTFAWTGASTTGMSLMCFLDHRVAAAESAWTISVHADGQVCNTNFGWGKNRSRNFVAVNEFKNGFIIQKWCQTSNLCQYSHKKSNKKGSVALPPPTKLFD